MGSTSFTAARIGYIAGLLDGEGHFRFQSSPAIFLKMTDKNVIYMIRNIIKPDFDIRVVKHPDKPGWEDAYVFYIHGSLAIQWMMTIYPLMGDRRKAKIREIISLWKETRNRGSRDMCHRGHPLIINGVDFILNLVGTKSCIKCRKITKEIRKKNRLKVA